MNQGKKLFGTAFFVVTNQAVFWIIYSQSANIVGSIGITAGVSICLLGILFWLKKVDHRKQQ
jgi:hypothetical protein